MAGQQEIIGDRANFWLYSPAAGFDLTHPATPASPPLYPRIPLQTTTFRIAIDPKKTALVVVDLQNYFLSPALGRPRDAGGLQVVERLVRCVIPACRQAEIPIVWLGWSLTPQDLEGMPPTILRAFAADTNFEGERRLKGLSSEIGSVELENGSLVDGGQELMRESWNAEPYPPLVEMYHPHDMWIGKNRLSGFWGGTETEEILTGRGIRTLLFAGVNTDQCVGGSLQDAAAKGWDCLLLSDGCATTNPELAQQCIELNCEQEWGFLLSCEDFAKGVENMQTTPGDML
ncbi:MAG: hypothetical protein Q9191_001743 [Dirinaria sp. TL-2023a]